MSKYTVERTAPNAIVTHSAAFKSFPKAFNAASKLQKTTASADVITIYEDGRLMDSFAGLVAPVKGREIVYDHGDYKMLYDGELIGYARTNSEAETTLNAYVYDLLMHQQD